VAEGAWLGALGHQALLLSLGSALLWVVRRPLLRLGAGAVYAAWLLLPALLLTPLLPRPTQEPLLQVLATVAAPAAPALGALPAPAPGHATGWLALWLAGAFAVAAMQAGRQWRLARHPDDRPAYTRALLAAHGLTPPRAPLASRWGSTHPLVERIAMLNRAQPLPRRRAALLGLALLGVVGLTYAAQATPAPSAAEAPQQKVDIRLNLSSGELKSAPRLITALGVRSRIEWGPAPEETWRLDFTVTRLDDGRLQVVTQPSYAGKPLGQHTGVLASGETFGQRIGGADGVPVLEMTRVVTLLPADFKMPQQNDKPRS
jgi:hypothetical protein